MAIDVTADDNVVVEEREERRLEVAWEKIGGGRWNIDVCNFDVEVGDFRVDEDSFRSAVIDWRWKLVKLHGVMDEGEEPTPHSPATSANTPDRSILPNDSEVGKGRSSRVRA